MQYQDRVQSGPYFFGISNAQGNLLRITDGYVEIEEGQEFGVYAGSAALSPFWVTVEVNGDMQGKWVLEPDEGAAVNADTLAGPAPDYGEGHFTVVRPRTQEWVDTGMDQVAKYDRGVVSLTFEAVLEDGPVPSPSLEVYRESFNKGGMGEATRSGISSNTHEAAGVGLSGEAVKYNTSKKDWKVSSAPVKLEISLVLKKKGQPTKMRPTGNRDVLRPPTL